MTNQSFSILHTPGLVTGRGSLSFFSTLGKKRVGIIKGGRSYHEDVKKIVEGLAAESGAEICYLASIRQEPYIDDIFACMDQVREFEPDLILAIGGGSVLDTAKAIHLFYENPELTFEEAQIPYTLPALGKKAVHISVPTTSGTGSETTSVAVFIDPETQVKKLLLDNTLIPHYAVLDANLTDSLPDEITLATGMDALTHAIEAGTALNASELVKSIAVEAALDLLENLPVCVDGEHGSEEWKLAKEKVHIASAMAGIAITNSCTGIAHSYDHPGPAFGIPHGTVCGLMLPFTMMLCGVQPSYVCLGRRLNLTGSSMEITEKLTEYLFHMRKKLGLPANFKELGIKKDEYESRVGIWAETSLNAFATAVSPAKMDKEKGLKLYKMCFDGRV